MSPQIELLSSVKINWPTLKATINTALGERPDRFLAQYPVSFKEDAEYLLYIAFMAGIPIKNPVNTLRNYPHYLLDYLHYTIMIACSDVTYREFADNSKLSIVTKESNRVHILLATGPLSLWYDTIVYNLHKDWKHGSDTRLLIDKIMLLLEKRGLKDLFGDYSKHPLRDGTFLLEKK